MSGQDQEILSYAAALPAKRGGVSALAVVAIVLAVLPFAVNGAILVTVRLRGTPNTGFGSLANATILTILCALFQIVMHIAASCVCIVARVRIRARPERYRKRWVGTLAAVICYGCLALDAAGVVWVFFVMQ